MNPIRIIRIIAAACVSAVFATGASAQVARTPVHDLKAQDSPQGFSVVLVLGDSQTSATADTVPPAARRALADMKDFLPYKGYRLLDAQWILGSQRSTTRLRGPADQEYQLALRSSMVGPSKMTVAFQLQEPGLEVAIAEAEVNARRQQGQELRVKLEQLQREAAALRQRFGEKHIAVQNASSEVEATKQRIANVETAPSLRGRGIIDTTFSMDVGETVVVGTSRVRSSDQALIALLTAVARATPPKKE
jgi:hypothetical protein